MKVTTKLILYKLVFALIVFCGTIFLYWSKWIGLGTIGIAFIYDFIVRRCPHCGEHISIDEHVNERSHCSHCGKQYNEI
ncbi:hypothetical protein [Anaeromicropila populeti]|uniref:Zinc-ribbon containing domain-containing protein n=1 Tax=Anaeromicropila populeti TaxID=37658 RepID=A0A1I6JWX6_9FIRM|nr:hypothetical protein [Anaeromicropila populeti]SFR83441.1 hypothetical protein SAMN05661086_02028 [Anaeromicropila populeti]